MPLRRPVPTPPPSTPAEVQVIRLTATQDQAVAAIDAGLRTARGDQRLVDALLDVRLILRPPARPA